jgi:biotin transport system substrate-specific component
MTPSLALPRNRHLLFAAHALGLSILIAASARISVPFWPVPMTLQTFAVLAIAGIGGARLGMAAMLAYLAEGALGLPVFASGAGVATLVGPTAGYLLGMLAAMVIVGPARGHLQRGVAMIMASFMIYALGATWLAQFVGIDRALAAGVLPFLFGDVAKIALAWALSAVVKRSDA